MELKMLHQPLSPAQQQKYEAYMMRKQGLRVPEPEDKQDKNSEGRKKAEEDDIHVKPMDVGKYNTINLQKELAKSMEELMLNGRQPAGDQVSLQEYRDQMAGQENSYADQSYDIEAEDTGEMIPQEYDPAQYGEETYTYEDLPAAAGPEYPEAQMQPEAAAAPQPDYYAVKEEPAAAVQEPVQESSGNPDPDLSNYLSQEYDGQIGLVVPDGYQVERQITGQMNIEDIMKDWEKMKLENEEKRRRQLQQRVMEQTDSLFRDFDKTARKGVLERLQKEERIPVERRRPPENNVISAHTKIWAAEEVENAMKRTEGAAAAVTAAAVVSAAAGVVPEAGMKELSGTAGRTAEEAAQPVPAPAVSQPVPAVPEAEPVYEEPSVPEPVPAVSRTADPIPEEEPEDRQPAYIEEPEDAAYEPEPEMDEDAGPEPEEDLENTQEMNARLEEERLEKEIRSMSREEKQLFASFVPTRGAMKKLVRALDQLSLAAYTGNLIITGDPGSDTLNLAKNIVKDVRAKDHNFSGKLAKIEGDAFNKKDAGELVVKLAGGALVIDNAGEIDDEGAGRLMDALNQEQTGILVILIDTKRNIKKLISANPEMESFFNARFDIEALDNGTLVAYGCQYAKMQEYAIDELGRLALHTRIEDMQTSDHIVTVNDVRDIVDEAIDHANRKTPKHFMDVLLAKRYDDDDMIILHEGDFI